MNRLISASAGSGKTYELTTQYLRLLHSRHQEVVSGNQPSLQIESLLAATFTRKAAAEIFDRVLKRLADAALHETKLMDLREALGEPTLSAETCQNILLHLCQNLHLVRVGTLDSFFQRLCKVYWQEAGLSSKMRMTSLDSPRCLALQKEALQAVLDEMADPKEADAMFQALTKQKASSSVVPSLLTLLQSIPESVGNAEPKHWKILDVPECPVQDDIDAAVESIRMAMPLFRLQSWKTAAAADLEKFYRGEWEDFWNKGLSHSSTKKPPTYGNAPDEISDQVIANYAVLRESARHELFADLKARTLATQDLYTKYSEKFIEGRKAEGIVLFSETPALLTKIIGNAAETARRLDSPVQHLLLDEFQDTSDPQWGLLKGFAQQAAISPGSVFVVGDAKQAIFGWRGGRAEIFKRLELDIQMMMKRETREKSYRSSEVVLDVVNKVFQDIATNEALINHTQTAELWAAYFNPHEAAGEKHGFFEMCVSPVPPDPQVAAPADDDGEEEEVEDDGKNWNAAGASYHLVQCAARIAGEIGRMPPGMSVGVLVRTNKTLAQMTDLLRSRDVQVSSEGIGKIADDPSVEVLLSGLLLADHPGHSAAAFHVGNSPLAEVLGIEPVDYTNSTKTAQIAASIRRRILSEGYSGVLAHWAASLAPYGPERTARRLEQILEMASAFDSLPPMRPSEFVRAVRESNAENPGTAPVRVMTINRSKGLEFDAVFLPDLEWKTRVSDKACLVESASVEEISGDGLTVKAIYARPNKTLQQLVPELLALSQIGEADEVTGMLCLLYVAMTRAKHALHLYVAPHKINQNGAPRQPGLKPAAILRAALAEGPADPRQGSDWTILRQKGVSDWPGNVAAPNSAPAPLPPSRPVPQFRESDGLRRGSPAHGREGAAQTAADLLRLE